MLNILDNKDAPKVIGLQVKGELSHADYQRLTGYLEGAIKMGNKIRIFCELDDMDSIEPRAMWDDLKFGLKHFNDIERIAVVGDQKWLELWTKMVAPVTPQIDVKHFGEAEKDAAWQWLNY